MNMILFYAKKKNIYKKKLGSTVGSSPGKAWNGSRPPHVFLRVLG